MRFGIWLKIIRPLNVKLMDFVSFPENKYSWERLPLSLSDKKR
ncbi:hypothetical protein BACEGG_00635 [Bacteroides eggerthii DSM 20697]|nr:hypothetical protein BACEGG_00635 [Bacteroides eggerthii DSM 20697]